MVDDRLVLTRVLERAIAAADPETVVHHALTTQALPDTDPVTVIAIGKAATAMTHGAVSVLGSRASGLVIAPTPTELDGFEVLVGDHPIPGDDSFVAGHRAMEVAREAPGLVLVLLSGGASAMAEVPSPGVSTSEVRERTQWLLQSGLPIEKMNRRRAELSALKAGGLTATARPSKVVTLALSDVAGAGPETIGSGPSMGSDEFQILADGSSASEAAARACAEFGIAATVLDGWMEGPARSVGHRFGTRARALDAGTGFITHGETTVVVDGEGRGGRNQELALAAAIPLEGSSSMLAAIDTDGVDGPTSNAGAIVDGSTTTRGTELGLDIVDHLERHDSASYLEAVGEVVTTGPTGTNVGDLVVGIRPP